MNIYEKLNACRLDFLQSKVPKRGVNKFANYTYFELDDILATCIKICEKQKVTTIITYSADIAKLYFIDVDKPEDKIEFTMPMSKASLKGCHEVQNLGAVTTYIKRYLYQACFEIAEQDALDATTGQPQQVTQPQVRQPQQTIQPQARQPQQTMQQKQQEYRGDIW